MCFQKSIRLYDFYVFSSELVPNGEKEVEILEKRDGNDVHLAICFEKN